MRWRFAMGGVGVKKEWPLERIDERRWHLGQRQGLHPALAGAQGVLCSRGVATL